MPQSETLHRPQTLKQAKKAFRKAGVLPRFSDAEIRRLNRAAELQERADREREKERKRKANLKKREERLAKEREARRKTNLLDVKQSHVAPNQLQLAFPGSAINRMQERTRAALGDKSIQPGQNTPEPTGGAVLSVLECPLQQVIPVATNNSKSTLFATSENAWDTCVEDWDEFIVSNTQLERELSAPKVEAPLMRCTRNPAPTSRGFDKPIDMSDLISTQGLELLARSPPPVTIVAVKGSRFKYHSTHGGEEVRTKSREGPNLNLLPPPANATLMKENSIPDSEADMDDFESDGIFTDEELGVLTRSFELGPAVKLQPTAAYQKSAPRAKIVPTQMATKVKDVEDSFNEENAPLSQELLALASSYDFDDFALSTQELQDLVP